MKHCTTCQFVFADTTLNCPHDNTLLRFVRELEPGMVIRGKYHIMQWIGAGGMAAVYRAKHRLLNEMRAIKVVLPKYANDDDFLKRFRHEAAIARRLRHENAVWVEDLDEIEDGRPFIAMEFLEGTDLRSVIQKEGSLTVARTLLLSEQIASALGAAHKLGITHRDIKPDNVFLTRTPDGREIAKVLDFGIAKVKEGAMETGFTATKTGILLGTPQYISPEQAIGKVGDKLDGRADLYSLGIVIYEMLTGRIPFESDTPMGMLLQHVNTIPRPPNELCPQLGIPQSVSLVLMKCLEKDRDKRFQTAEELIVALRDPEKWMVSTYGANVAQTPPPPPPPKAPLGATVVVSPVSFAEPAVRPAEQRPQVAQQSAPNLQANQSSAYAPQRTMPIEQQRSVAREAVQTIPQPGDAQQERNQGRTTQRRPSESPKHAGLIVAIVAVVVLCTAGILYFTLGSKTKSDADIRQDITQRFQGAFCCDSLRSGKVTADVNHGVVTLKGEVPVATDRTTAMNLVSNVEGIKSVNNNITIEATPTPAPTVHPTQPPHENVQVPEPVHTKSPQPTLSEAAKEASAWIDQARSKLKNAENPDYDGAIRYYKMALDADPNNAVAKRELAEVIRQQRAEQDVFRNRR